jgi:hypothetical protein
MAPTPRLIDAARAARGESGSKQRRVPFRAGAGEAADTFRFGVGVDEVISCAGLPAGVAALAICPVAAGAPAAADRRRLPSDGASDRVVKPAGSSRPLLIMSIPSGASDRAISQTWARHEKVPLTIAFVSASSTTRSCSSGCTYGRPFGPIKRTFSAPGRSSSIAPSTHCLPKTRSNAARRSSSRWPCRPLANSSSGTNSQLNVARCGAGSGGKRWFPGAGFTLQGDGVGDWFRSADVKPAPTFDCGGGCRAEAGANAGGFCDAAAAAATFDCGVDCRAEAGANAGGCCDAAAAAATLD